MQDDRAVIGYQIEFDETGQILRLKQRRNAGGDGGETNATLAVLAACLTCDMSDSDRPWRNWLLACDTD